MTSRHALYKLDIPGFNGSMQVRGAGWIASPAINLPWTASLTAIKNKGGAAVPLVFSPGSRSGQRALTTFSFAPVSHYGSPAARSRNLLPVTTRPACPVAPAILRPACCRQGALPAARRGVGAWATVRLPLQADCPKFHGGTKVSPGLMLYRICLPSGWRLLPLGLAAYQPHHARDGASKRWLLLL